LKILLINVPVNFNAFENSQPPLGISYIASACLQKNITDIKLKDYEVEPFLIAEFSSLLLEFRPEIVGFSCRTASYPSTIQLSEYVRNTISNTKIIFGGHHPTALAHDVLIETVADVVVRKEGEETFPELVKTFEECLDLSVVDGISYRMPDGKIYHNKDRGYVANLDALPLPAWDLLPMERYAYGVVLSSRGCPFDCVYCDKHISTKNVRYRSEESVIEELSLLVSKYKKDMIYFDDDHFMLNKTRFYRILDLLKEKNIFFRWKCQARVDSIDLVLLKRAKAAGCVEIIFGVETGDSIELEFINKLGNATLAQVEKVFKWANEIKLHTRANFMLGFPVSTVETTVNSIRFAASLRADNYRFFHVVPLPNTRLWDYCMSKKMIPETVDWKNFTFVKSILRNDNMSPELLDVYSGAAYLHVFWKKVLGEITIFLPVNLFRLIVGWSSVNKFSSLLFRYFPGFANLFSALYFLVKNKKCMERLIFILKIIKINRTL
jgi:radical SAM superfamily enzyme YgiQ (UPF0313 family)